MFEWKYILRIIKKYLSKKAIVQECKLAININNYKIIARTHFSEEYINID